MSEVLTGELVDPKVAVPTAEVPHSSPFLYFEDAPGLGHLNGIYRVLLTAARLVPMSDGSARNVHTAVAQLQGNREALLSLRQAIDNALLLGTKPEGQAN